MCQELINFHIFQAGWTHENTTGAHTSTRLIERVPSDPSLEAQLRPKHIAVGEGSQDRVGQELGML
jgi:hypothetical protein